MSGQSAEVRLLCSLRRARSARSGRSPLAEYAGALAARVIDEDEARHRVGPPPVEHCVQGQAGQHGGGEDPVHERYPPLGTEHDAVQMIPAMLTGSLCDYRKKTAFVRSAQGNIP